jgi:3-phenylpropionate/trans-cinnamate dioxygenase ferredoxin subunit
MSEWITVIKESEFPPGNRKSLIIKGLPIVIFKLEDAYYAIHNQCPHQNLPLEEGDIEGDLIVCPHHGAKFCIKTGEVKNPPAFEDVVTYPTRIENNIIQIKI